jgi:lipopolysaccharide export system protein LptA
VSGPTTHLRNHLLFSSLALIGLALVVCLIRSDLRGQTGPALPAETLPATKTTQLDPISIESDYSQEWNDIENNEKVLLLRGRCRMIQGITTLSSQKMVIWKSNEHTALEARDQFVVYLEGDVRVERPGRTLTESTMLIRLATRAGVIESIRGRIELEDPATEDSLYQRAAQRRGKQRRVSAQRNMLRQTQLIVSDEDSVGPELRSVQIQPLEGSLRRIRIFPRSSMPFQASTTKMENTTPPEQVYVLTGGITLLIDGMDEFGTIDMSADRMVIWTRARQSNGLETETVQTRDEPFQVYLEGNIVLRQGQRVVRADRAIYDAKEDRALMYDAELKTYVPALRGDLRIKANRLRQLSRDSFHAQDAWVSASRFGKPGYRLQSTDIFLENRYVTPWTLLSSQLVDPLTGALQVEEVPWVTSLHNTFLIEDFPLFYTPYLSSPAEDPNVSVRRVTITQDRIFGFQVKAVWDLFNIIGIEEPNGIKWDLTTEYLSERGPAIGSGGSYKGRDIFGIPGLYSGEVLGYYIRDSGEDRLGQDRLSLDPDDDDRYRLQARHRHDLPDEMTILGEIGLLSDRNFLESFYEHEFDRDKDVETVLYVQQRLDNLAWTVQARPQLNDFETTTGWLPRGDLYLLSEPLFGGRLSWSSHTSAGFGQLRQGNRPSNPDDLWTPLPFVADLDGAVLMTRHEVISPFSLGPLRLSPFALGEAAFWSEDFNGNDIDRFIGSAGIRSSLMFWKVFPFVYSRMFNLNGLAHKVSLESEYAWTESTEDLANLPQYNEFDDNAQERFRQRFLVNTFGGTLPAVFEPRFYALRTGAGRSVTAGYHELIDDQQVASFAVRQRLQTKVGPPDRMRIKDWMTLDLQASFFPNASRDNFGEDLGLLNANYRWNVGDRTSILASAYYDLFDDAQQLWNVAFLTQRSERGSLYFGMRQIKGAGLNSQILSASYSYKMSPKWISTLGTAFDLGESRNAGQSLTITRVGADFLIHFGASFDESKDNAGLAVAIEPRFGPMNNSSTRLGSLLGSP